MIYLPLWLRVPLATLAVGLNVLLHVPPLLLLALIKALLPKALRKRMGRVLIAISQNWIAVNSGLIALFTRTKVMVDCDVKLNPDGHYLVLANHQSWVDIPILQQVFNRRIPFLRFFLKSQLIWVPLLGLAWWALDFPFMKRYSRSEIARKPELAGRDIDATRKACAKFRDIPVSIMNFVEGTRFTPAKHAKQQSPHQHLLKPKAGGVAFVLDAMGDALDAVLDVTVVYPSGPPTLLDLIRNQVAEVHVHIQQHPIPDGFSGAEGRTSSAALAGVRSWVNEVWSEKDRRIAGVLKQRAQGTGPRAQ